MISFRRVSGSASRVGLGGGSGWLGMARKLSVWVFPEIWWLRLDENRIDDGEGGSDCSVRHLCFIVELGF